MPRENRKRGKKHKKPKEEDNYGYNYAKPTFEPEPQPEPEAEPSWMVSAPPRDAQESSQDAIFGVVDAEVKAYFRTVDLQMRDWQENQEEADETEGVDPNEGMSF